MTVACNGHSPTNTSVRSGVPCLKRPWPLANVSGCADSNCQLPVAGVYVHKIRPSLSKQSRGKSTLKSSRWSKILTHLEMRLPSGGHERRSRWSRAVSATHFFVPFFLPYKIFALFCLCSYQHRAATCLAASKKLGGEMRPSPKPLYLSQPLHRPG